MLHSHPPLIALSSVLYKIEQNSTLVPTLVLHRFEQKWMCHFHGILKLPCSLFRTVVLPLHLYLSYVSIPEHGHLPVEDAHWLDSELSLRFHLNHIPIYHMVRIMYIFLKQRNMKDIMSSSASKQCKSICNWPYAFKHSNGPQYLSDSLAQLPSFKELFLALTLR